MFVTGRRSFLLSLFAAVPLTSLCALVVHGQHKEQPTVRKDPVIEVIHGVPVEDPYRWLENADDPEVQEWVRRQNAHTRRVLDSLPFREQLRARLLALHRIPVLGTPVPRQDRVFYLRREPDQNQPVLFVQDGNGTRRPLVDPNLLSEDGTVAIDWYYPSPNGSLVAYGLSEAGSERSTLHLVSVDDGQLLDDVIPHTRACSVAWLPDSSGFYYTRYPAPGEVPAGEENYHRHVFFHRVGSPPSEDAEVFGQGRPKEDWPVLDLSPDGRWLTVTVHQGWSRSEVYVADRKQTPLEFRPVATGREAIFSATALDDAILLYTNWEAPRYRVLALDPEQPDLQNARELVAEAGDTLQDVVAAGGHLLLHYLHNVSSRIQLIRIGEQQRKDIALPSAVTVAGIGAEKTGARAFIRIHSFVRPTEVLTVDLSSGETTLWEKVQAPLDPADYVVKQVWYTSKDGTQIPMFIIHRKDVALDGNRPTVLYGYGGFNISITPRFWNSLPVWLDAGGVFAVANLRGGSEFGEEWHRAGMLHNKQNVFDDFIAAAEWLIANGYTNPKRLAIMGRSNGGLLVAAAMTQRPDLFRAAVCGVPLTDMVRYHRFLIARLWIPEYGDPDNPEDFRYLYAYSPYHHVRDGEAYPAVLITTAESDTRVDPAHARKFAARLQEASSSGLPILLRVEEKAGHGAGKPVQKIVAEETDVWSFLFWQLGVEFPSEETNSK